VRLCSVGITLMSSDKCSCITIVSLYTASWPVKLLLLLALVLTLLLAVKNYRF